MAKPTSADIGRTAAECRGMGLDVDAKIPDCAVLTQDVGATADGALINFSLRLAFEWDTVVVTPHGTAT